MASEHQIEYQKAVELAEAGSYEQALSHIENYLKNEPNDVQALNDAGAILHCLGRSEQAIRHLMRANELNSDNPQVVWNLIETYLAAQKPERVRDLFEQAEKIKILNPDIYNRTATQFIDQGKKGEAVNIIR
jgi:Flp pilus assembly protein TadD